MDLALDHGKAFGSGVEKVLTSSFRTGSNGFGPSLRMSEMQQEIWRPREGVKGRVRVLCPMGKEKGRLKAEFISQL